MLVDMDAVVWCIVVSPYCFVSRPPIMRWCGRTRDLGAEFEVICRRTTSPLALSMTPRVDISFFPPLA